MIRFTCRNCGDEYEVAADLAGHIIMCRFCQKHGRVPPPPSPYPPIFLADWYIKEGSGIVGPFTLEQMEKKALTGEIRPETEVARRGSREWMRADRLALPFRVLPSCPTSFRGKKVPSPPPPSPPEPLIQYWCPTCNSRLTASPHEAGSRVLCPKCRQKLLVPSPVQAKTVLGIPAVTPFEDFPPLTLADWYIKEGSGIEGPFTAERMEKKARSGEIRPETEIRRGDNGWRRAERFAFLLRLMPSSPTCLNPNISWKDVREKFSREWKKWSNAYKVTFFISLLLVIAVMIAILKWEEKPRHWVLQDKGGSDIIPVALSEAALDRLNTCLNAGDDIGVRQLVLAGLVFSVPSGTEVIIIESGWSNYEVRIMGGSHYGQAVWVSLEFVKYVPKK